MKVEISKTHCETETATLKLPSHSEHCITVRSSETFEMNRSLWRAAEDVDASAGFADFESSQARGAGSLYGFAAGLGEGLYTCIRMPPGT